MERNFGILKFSWDIVEESPEVVGEILSWLKFVPLRAECLAMNRIYQMEGYSQRFELVIQNEMSPEYRVIVDEHEDKSMTFSLEKVESKW